jgi:hypothetical protein
MIANKETTHIKDERLLFEHDHCFENHRMEQDRRREHSEGYTYISSVGWIDRREMLRRKGDPYGC